MALSATGVTESAFERLGSSRRRDMISVKRLFCYLASGYGYTDTEIGIAVRLTHTTVLMHREKMSGYVNYYESERVLVERSKAMLEGSFTVEGYLARNDDIEGGYLRFFHERPIRGNYFWGTDGRCYILQDDLYPEIQWETEPVKAELKIRLL